MKRVRASQRGSTILEFAIIGPLLLLLFFGVIGTGIALGRYLQATQIGRDLAHMYASGVDFSQTINKAIAIQLASGTGMTTTSGNGVVMFSAISTVYQSDCAAAGYATACGNLGQAVMVQRIVIGDSTLRSSAFGTPTAGLMDGQGNIAPSVYLRNTDSSVRANGFTALLAAAGITQAQGDISWVVELYFPYPDLSYLGAANASGAYVRFLF